VQSKVAQTTSPLSEPPLVSLYGTPEYCEYSGKGLLVSPFPYAVAASRSALGYFLSYPALKKNEFLQSILSCAFTRLQSVTSGAPPHNSSHFSKPIIPFPYVWTEAQTQEIVGLAICARLQFARTGDLTQRGHSERDCQHRN